MCKTIKKRELQDADLFLRYSTERGADAVAAFRRTERPIRTLRFLGLFYFVKRIELGPLVMAQAIDSEIARDRIDPR